MMRSKLPEPATPRSEAAEALYALASPLIHDGQSLMRLAVRMAAGDASHTLTRMRRYITDCCTAADAVRQIINAYEMATMTPEAIAKHRRAAARRQMEREKWSKDRYRYVWDQIADLCRRFGVEECADALERIRALESAQVPKREASNVVSLFCAAADEPTDAA